MNIPESIIGIWYDAGVIRSSFTYSDEYGSIGGYTYLKTSGGYAFNCCGAEIFQHLSTSFTSLKEKQNFVWYMRRNTSCLTHYMLAASCQLEDNYSTFGNVIQVLRDLGAKEVDKRPNRTHGPNQMHLFVWAPNVMDDTWWQFLDKKTGNPLWWQALSEKKQQKKISEAQPKWEFHQQQVHKQKERQKKQNINHVIGDFLKAIRKGEVTPEILSSFGYELPKQKAL